MSITRSPSPPEPPTKAGIEDAGAAHADSLLIVVGHGTGTAAGDASLHALVADLAENGAFAGVKAAVLHGDPSLAAAVHDGKAGPIRLLPFLMSGGVTFRKRLGEAMAEISWPETPLLYPPLGFNPDLAELVVRRAKAAAKANSWPVAESHLLLIGHGSLRDPESAQATRSQQQRIAAQGLFASVEAAFLDQPPRLTDVLASHPGPLLGVGLFAGEGQHGARDMALAFAQAACPARYCGAIGGDSGLAALALSHLRTAPWPVGL